MSTAAEIAASATPNASSVRIPSGDSRWMRMWNSSIHFGNGFMPKKCSAGLSESRIAAPAIPASNARRGGTPAMVTSAIVPRPSKPSRLATA